MKVWRWFCRWRARVADHEALMCLSAAVVASGRLDDEAAREFHAWGRDAVARRERWMRRTG